MNSRLILAAGAACLFAVAGSAHSQGTQQGAQPSTQPAMQQNADTPAQSVTDTSYGGAPATRSATGGVRSSSCSPRPQCDVFFGN
jgi:hypothetical protein